MLYNRATTLSLPNSLLLHFAFADFEEVYTCIYMIKSMNHNSLGCEQPYITHRPRCKNGSHPMYVICTRVYCHGGWFLILK